MIAKTTLNSMWFVAGLVMAAGLATWLEGASFAPSDQFKVIDNLQDPPYALAQPRNITAEEKHFARVAWDFIDTQTQSQTGLVNSVADFPSSTLWDQGSYLMALVAAAKLEVIDQEEFDHRTDRFLESIGKLELIDGVLPNKVYNTQTLAMTDYADKLTPDGIGWSALDIARLLLAFRILERYAPEYGADIRKTIAAWDLTQVAQGGELTGTSLIEGEMQLLQEGRIGYEQYGARAAAMWGMDVNRAISATRKLNWKDIEGVQVPVDSRVVSRYRTINPVTSEPYVLMGLEMGFDMENLRLAGQVLAAQEARFERIGIMTVVSEDHLDKAPHFAYASVFSNNRPWAVVDSDGTHHADARTQSVKASFGWDALFDTAYTNVAAQGVTDLAVPGKGWYAGIYETDGSVNKSLALNTNAVILVALHYKEFGPLWRID
ncbi:MAG: DUF3131 domain-containing protein [Planktomarina sp.]